MKPGDRYYLTDDQHRPIGIVEITGVDSYQLSQGFVTVTAVTPLHSWDLSFEELQARTKIPYVSGVQMIMPIARLLPEPKRYDLVQIIPINHADLEIVLKPNGQYAGYIYRYSNDNGWNAQTPAALYGPQSKAEAILSCLKPAAPSTE